MIALEVEQGSPEWHAARCGIPTASNFDQIVTTKGDPSKQAQKYLYRLAGERVSGRAEETYQNAAMARGIEMEAEARAYYELTNGVTVQKVGICYANEQKLFSCSPDGLVGEDGMVDFKCPLIHTHVGYLLSGGLEVEYWQQLQGQLAVTGRKWVDIMSYFPGLKPLIIRVERDEVFIGKLAVALDKFCAELEEVVRRIQ